METVWKYEIPIKDYFEILIPQKAKVLSVGMQETTPVMWVLVDSESIKTNKAFRLTGTGHPLDIDEDDELKFIGTLQYQLGLVFHLFEIGSHYMFGVDHFAP
jgi:hypothetical protein